MIYKAKVKSVKNTYITVDVPELGIEDVMVKYLLAPYSVPSKVGIKMNLPKEGDDVFIMFMNEKIYANPVIVPLVPVSDLQDKKELVIHANTVEIIGEGNSDVDNIKLGKSFLTEAVRYDVLLAILRNIYNVILMHKHILPFPPGASTLVLSPDDIGRLVTQVNPDTATIVTQTVAGLLKEVLKSKKVKLE